MKSLHKKVISILTIFTVIFSISLSGCDTSQLNASTETCDNGHNLVQSSYTAPTCKTNGEEVQKCTRCGFENKKTLLTIDHDYKVKSTTDSTCTVQGKTIYECTMCREAKTDILPCAAHSYVAKNKPRTCFTDGYDYNECSVCGDRQTTKTYPKLTHSFSSQNTTDYSRCANCGVGSALYRVKKIQGYLYGKIGGEWNSEIEGYDYYCITIHFEIDRPDTPYPVAIPDTIETPKNYYIYDTDRFGGESNYQIVCENGLPKIDNSQYMYFTQITDYHYKEDFSFNKIRINDYVQLNTHRNWNGQQEIPNEYPTSLKIVFNLQACDWVEV